MAYQRFPLYARPLPFLLSGAALLFGLWQGLNWTWDWSLQTGNVFILITIPTQLIDLASPRSLFLVLALVGLVALATVGRASRSTAEAVAHEGLGGFWAPRFRFYPLTFLLGLFLTYFGVIFLFKASVTADDTPGGFVAFVYLNYAGIVSRALVSIVSALILGVGVTCATGLAFKAGLGLRTEATAPSASPAPGATAIPLAASPEPVLAPPPAAPRNVVRRAVVRPARTPVAARAAAPSRPGVRRATPVNDGPGARSRGPSTGPTS